MALALFDRVQETTTTTGTGSITLAGAVPGFQSFAVVGNGNTCYYTIVDGSAWEVGVGTYSTSGPTLARTTILSNSSGNTTAITLAAGTKSVFLTYPASKSVNLNESGNVSALGTVSSGVWQGTTVGVAYGGTGVTASTGANSVVLRDSSQNIAVNRLNQSNTNITAAGGTTTLTAASSYSQTLVGTGTQTIKMPDATSLTTGVAFEFNNNATGTLTLTDNANATVATVTSGGAVELVLLANATVAGTWDVHGYLPENVTWGTNALNLGTTVISGGTWNGGTIATGYGGTGLTSYTSGGAVYANSTTTLTSGTLPLTAGGTAATTAAGARTSLDVPSTSGSGATGTWGISITGSASGSAGSVVNAATFNNGGAGDASGTTFNGSAARTISYNTIGAPSTTGTNASGTWSISVTGNAATATILKAINVTATGVSNWNPGGLTYQAWGQYFTNSAISSDSGDITMWLRPSQYSGGGTELNMYIDGDYYSGTGAYRVLNAGNFNSYAPTLTGTGATGTWNINISGSAASATTASSSPLLSALGTYVWSASTLPSGYNGGIQCSFVQSSNGWQSYGSVMTMRTYTGSGGGALQMYVPYSPTYGGTGMQVRFGNYDGAANDVWTSWKTLLASDNYNSYTPTLTGTGASGTWNISITGSAGSAGSVDYNALTNKGGGTGSYITSGDYRAPIFYDSNDTGYYVDPNNMSSMFGVAIRGDSSTTGTSNQIFFWGPGNTTTSAIGFKANGGYFPNPTGNGDGYNTYLTMDSDGRGWVFRRGVGGSDFGAAYTSGWILNNGLWQANASMRAPIFYDSNNTAYYVDPAGTSNLNAATFNGQTVWNGQLYISGTNFNTLNSGYNNPADGSDIWLNYRGYNDGFSYFRNFNVGNGKGTAYVYGDGANQYLGIGTGQSASARLHVRQSTPTSIGALPSGVTMLSDSSTNNYLLFRNTADNGTYSGIAFQDNNVGGYVVFGNAGGGGDLLYVAGYNGGQLQYGYTDSINPGARTTIASWNPTGLQINSGDMRAPIYYDSDNTGYYFNGAGSTQMNIALMNNLEAGGLGRSTNNTIGANIGTAVPVWNNSQLEIKNTDAGNVGIAFHRAGYSSVALYSSGGNLQSDNSFYAPILYDYNNSGYYCDPASTSNFVGLTVANTISGNISGNAGYASYAGYLPTAYAGGVQSNPQVYFNEGIGLKAAMTGVPFAWCDTLWINGYSGSDVPNMIALHTARNGQTRMWMSSQSNRATSYGTLYEIPAYGLLYNTGNLYAGTFYDAEDTARYFNGNGGVNFITGSGNRVTVYSDDSGWHVSNAEGTGVDVRLGAAYGLPGIYVNPNLYLSSESNVIFRIANGERGYIDVSSNLFAYGSMRAPIFYDQNNTAYYVDPASTSRLNETLTNVVTLPQNPVGSTYGNGVSATPPYSFYQTCGDNDGMRIYSEAPSSNNVRMVFQLEDDIETAYSDQWVFRNKLTYGAYTATSPFAIGGSGNVTAAGNVTAYSDERLKTNWRDMPDNFVARLANVKVGIYDRTDTKNMTQVGVSAQSLQEVLPQAVNTADNEMKTLSVSYGNAALASAVELAKYVTALEQRISQLEARL